MASQDSSPGIYQHEVSAAGPSTSTTIFPYVARENSLVPVRRDARAQSTSRVGSKSSARKWPVAHKMAISIVLVSSFFVVTLAPSIYITSIPGIMTEFQVKRSLGILPISLIALGLVVCPEFTPILTKKFGRQYINRTILSLHLIFTVVGALAQDLRSTAVCLTMVCLVGSPSVSVFADMLTDLWQIPGGKNGVLLFGINAAFFINPVVGESFVASFGWPSSFWLTAILAGSCFVGILFVPETSEPETPEAVPCERASHLPTGKL